MSFPFFGEEFTFTQPDGGKLRVRGFGDQHHARFETLDGFTVDQARCRRQSFFKTLRGFDLYACNLCRRLCPLRLGH